MATVKEVRAVRNACTLLETMARSQPVGVSELARTTGIDKSAVHRLAVTLHAAGWLDRAAGGRWQISAGLPGLVQDSAVATLVASARPLLDRARDETGETAMLVVPEPHRLRIVAVAESGQNLRVTATEGVEMPAPRSAALRAIAAHLSPAELDGWRGIDPELTDAALAEVRSRGWSVNDAELTPDARGVAAALNRPDGTALAALVLCGPSTRFRSEDADAYGRLVAHLAAEWQARAGATATNGAPVGAGASDGPRRPAT